MQTRHVPALDRRYWLGILFASIFGTNLGDFYAHESGLGLGLGLLVLVILFAATCWFETKSGTARETYYWLAIIIIRTGATNIADYLAYRVRIAGILLACGLAAALAAFAWSGSPRHAPPDIGPATATLSKTDLTYWAAMLAAGVFGTVAGDICSHRFGQGPASLGLAILLAILLIVTKSRVATSIAIYWCAVALARTAGTCIGDWCAQNKIVPIGLPLSTLMTGAMFVVILTMLRRAQPESRAAA